MAAPGVRSLSTVPAALGSYKRLSGTSMATPHVAAAVALRGPGGYAEERRKGLPEGILKLSNNIMC